MPSSMRKAAGWTSRTRGRRPMLYGSVGPRPRKDYSCKINGRAASNHPASTYINSMKTLYELERSSCRWPIADLTLPGRRPGSQHLFCGKPAAPGKPYCREHAAARAFGSSSLQNRGIRPIQGRAQIASWSASKPKGRHNFFRSLGGFAIARSGSFKPLLQSFESDARLTVHAPTHQEKIENPSRASHAIGFSKRPGTLRGVAQGPEGDALASAPGYL